MKSYLNIKTPKANKISHFLEAHGDKRKDDYYWLRLSDNQKLEGESNEQTKAVLDHLRNENAYREMVMSDIKPFQDSLYEEMIGRIKKNDTSVPYFSNHYWYLTTFQEGKEYAIRSRRKERLDAEDQLLIDENLLAASHSYFSTSGRNVSPNNKIFAYGEDTISRRQYNIKFIDLDTGRYLDDFIPNTTGSVVWSNDNAYVFYCTKDSSLRSYKILRHKLGTVSTDDVEVFHEKDEAYSAFVYKSKSKKYIIIGSSATLSQEYRILNADYPENDFVIFQERVKDLEHSIDHINDKWFIKTNEGGATNFKIVTTSETNTTKNYWEIFQQHNNEILVEDLDLFSEFMVVSERIKGITRLKIQPWNGESHYIDFGEDAYVAQTSTNPEADSLVVRLEFSSLTTPWTTYDYNVSNRILDLKKQQEVLGGFDKSEYQSERIYVKSRDGKEIPMSIVYKKGLKKNGIQPFLLYGYGSYGYSSEPYFVSSYLSLLDRGFGYAVAHVRGGQELGRMWYEDGKFLTKKNSFFDFIDCAEFLILQNYCSPTKLFAMGGSAGGLLVGAVVNLRPDLWKGAIVAVPFVDVVTTMLDETIPLTTGEFDEWGNPNDQIYYEYMKSYSPYDNIERKDYPALLVTTGYHDSQVQYWEPAKYVAKLRELKTNNNPILLYCDMEVGHGGASGRFERYKITAMEYAFILNLADITK